jgi:hypothetical protein
MRRYVHPHLTVAQAGPVLEQELRKRFGDAEFEKLYQTLDSQTAELADDEEAQLLIVRVLIERTKDQTNLFLSIVWLAKKEGRDPLVREMLEITRHKTLLQPTGCATR